MEQVPIHQIIQSFENKLSEKEKEELDAWLSSSEENRQQFEELRKTYTATGKLKIDFNPDAKKGLEKVNERIQSGKTKHIVWRAAAALLLLALATQLVLQIQAPNNRTEIVAQQRQIVFLPDSSKVILAKNACLSYPKTFKKNERDVKLNGTAYFEITKKPGKPFQIKTQHTKIEVLGTKFLVEASNPDAERVTVDEGKVAFTTGSLFTREKVILTENEIGSWNAKTKKLSEEINQQQNRNSWLSGNFNFRELALSEVLKILEQHFNKKIELSDKNFGSLRLSGRFNSDTSIEEIIEIICQTLNLSYEKDKNTYIIKP
ncbi:FecR family protein [Maribellus maritimus]|uniref:FecR family protein n=1 Tax=Maribellus maritimus TaxID=2870838 RepID=UPI001EEB4625|nr:FecR family protein [Maribellus maritimus]MCG6190168.1 FecR family protein [Maribellus maritimus]